MKAFQFLTFLLLFVFCTTGCVKQLETDFEEMETQVEEAAPESRETYPPKISSITDFCGNPGNIEEVIVTHANYATTVTLDIFSENGARHIARYTKANPDLLFQLGFTIGFPLDGSYGCSFLTQGTTYRIRVSNDPNIDPVWFSWSTWPLPNVIDEFTTIDPCICNIRK